MAIRKKATNKERDAAITHLLKRVSMIEQVCEANQSILQMYVKFKDDTDKFNKWMTFTMENAIKEVKDDSKKVPKAGKKVSK